MMYEEFAERCMDRNITPPAPEIYAEKIEPVYNYHPAFDCLAPKDYAADLYKLGGVAVYDLMRENADIAAAHEQEMAHARSVLESCMLWRQDVYHAWHSAKE